jgi:hypothetical protein
MSAAVIDRLWYDAALAVAAGFCTSEADDSANSPAAVVRL